MSKARTFLKVEMEDAARCAAEHGMSAILRPTGEIEFVPAIHSRRTHAPVDEAPLSKADQALQDWVARDGQGKNVRRPQGH